MCANVATETGRVYLFCRQFGQLTNSGYISAGLNVRLTRTAANFACDAFTAVLKREFGVRISCELRAKISVTSSAGSDPTYPLAGVAMIGAVAPFAGFDLRMSPLLLPVERRNKGISARRTTTGAAL